MDKKKNKRLRYGSYYLLMTALVIGFLIVVNLIVGKINKSIDLTNQQLYSLSEESKAVLSAVNDDIIIYKLFKTGSNEEIITTANEILNNYTAACPYVKAENRDPYIHPKFVEKYEEKGEVPVNSLIVEHGNRFKVIEPSKFYSKSAITGEDVLDMESQITNAVIYCMLEKTPVVGYVTGHGEESIPENIRIKLENMGYEIRELNLNSTEKMPEDIDFVLMTTVKKDYSEHEADLVKSFLMNEGRVMVCLNFSVTDFPNLESIINAYGVKATNGVVRENNPANYYAGDADIVIPNVADFEATKVFYEKGYSPRLKFPQPLKETDVKKNTLKITPILTTSEQSYSTYDDNRENTAYAESDEKGPFTVGYAVVDSGYTDELHTTKVIVIGSSAFLSDGTDLSTGGFNSEFAVQCIDWLNDNSSGIYIEPKSVTVKEAEVNGADAFNITLVTCGIIPFGILLTGFIVWFKRRNR